MKRSAGLTVGLFAAPTLWAAPALAHFGMTIPSEDVVMDKAQAKVGVTVSFSHPMEGSGMVLEKPAAFYVMVDGKKQDLSNTLQPATVYEQQAWNADFAIARPGLYQFVMEPIIPRPGG